MMPSHTADRVHIAQGRGMPYGRPMSLYSGIGVYEGRSAGTGHGGRDGERWRWMSVSGEDGQMVGST